MTEIALVWDRPLLFEKLFVEYGFACERVSPLQIGSPYAPKFDVAILPVGFGNPAYSTVAKSVKSLGTPLRQFVQREAHWSRSALTWTTTTSAGLVLRAGSGCSCEMRS